MGTLQTVQINGKQAKQGKEYVIPICIIWIATLDGSAAIDP